MTSEEKERLSVVETQVSNLCSEIIELKLSVKELWDKIDNLSDDIKKRLPLWATLAFVSMSSLIVGLVVNTVK